MSFQECSVYTLKMFEAMFRVIKESENVDERQHCFLIQAFGKASHYFSVETRQELLRLESAWHKSVCLAISHLGSKTFHVVYRNRPSALSLGDPLTPPNSHLLPPCTMV